MENITIRFFFSSLESAVTALILVLEDARKTDKNYIFGSLSAQQILASGLMLAGDAQHVADQIAKLPGVTSYEE